MCNNFLPDSVNAFLDDVETTTCLPILVIIVICTLQFILNHVFDITYIIVQTIQDKLNNNGNDNGTNLISKLKDMLNNLIFQKSPINPTSSSKSNTAYRRNNRTDIPQEEEW